MAPAREQINVILMVIKLNNERNLRAPSTVPTLTRVTRVGPSQGEARALD